MIDGEHGVRLAAAKSGLKLNDRLAAFTDKALRDLRQQKAMPSVMNVRSKNATAF